MSHALLVGGPFDGQERDIDPTRYVITIEWTEGTWNEPDKYGFAVEVKRVNFATYERRGDETFVYVPSHPSEAGDEKPWDQLMLPPTDEEGKGYGR